MAQGMEAAELNSTQTMGKINPKQVPVVHGIDKIRPSQSNNMDSLGEKSGAYITLSMLWRVWTLD